MALQVEAVVVGRDPEGRMGGYWRFSTARAY